MDDEQSAYLDRRERIIAPRQHTHVQQTSARQSGRGRLAATHTATHNVSHPFSWAMSDARAMAILFSTYCTLLPLQQMHACPMAHSHGTSRSTRTTPACVDSPVVSTLRFVEAEPSRGTCACGNSGGHPSHTRTAVAACVIRGKSWRPRSPTAHPGPRQLPLRTVRATAVPALNQHFTRQRRTTRRPVAGARVHVVRLPAPKGLRGAIVLALCPCRIGDNPLVSEARRVTRMHVYPLFRRIGMETSAISFSNDSRSSEE